MRGPAPWKVRAPPDPSGGQIVLSMQPIPAGGHDPTPRRILYALAAGYVIGYCAAADAAQVTLAEAVAGALTWLLHRRA